MNLYFMHFPIIRIAKSVVRELTDYFHTPNNSSVPIFWIVRSFRVSNCMTQAGYVLVYFSCFFHGLFFHFNQREPLYGPI